jgi:hypothetical protein
MTSEDLSKPFGLPFSNFSAPILWQDGLGFSTTEDYGDGYASLYKFGIYNQESQGDLKKIWTSVSYGRKNQDGISLGTGKNGMRDPLDLDFHDEFFYDEKQKKFFHYGKEIEAKKILLDVEKTHKKPTKIIGGVFLRCRLWYWRLFVPGLIKVLDGILIFVLRLISGEKLQKDLWGRLFSINGNEQSNKPIPDKYNSFEDGKTMEFFGYKAKRWSVVFYCLIHIIAYVIYFYGKLRVNLLSNILGNNFLAICYVVVTFSISESLIPSMLKSAILKINPRFFSRAISKRIKVS